MQEGKKKVANSEKTYRDKRLYRAIVSVNKEIILTDRQIVNSILESIFSVEKPENTILNAS